MCWVNITDRRWRWVLHYGLQPKSQASPGVCEAVVFENTCGLDGKPKNGVRIRKMGRSLGLETNTCLLAQICIHSCTLTIYPGLHKKLFGKQNVRSGGKKTKGPYHEETLCTHPDLLLVSPGPERPIRGGGTESGGHVKLFNLSNFRNLLKTKKNSALAVYSVLHKTLYRSFSCARCLIKNLRL